MTAWRFIGSGETTAALTFTMLARQQVQTSHDRGSGAGQWGCLTVGWWWLADWLGQADSYLTYDGDSTQWVVLRIKTDELGALVMNHYSLFYDNVEFNVVPWQFEPR